MGRIFGRLATAFLFVCGLQTPAGAYSWSQPHGNSTNSGFFDAATLPATAPLKVVSGIGTIAPGAGPVVAADGTVYLGNEQGKVMAFRPDGTPWWSRDVPGSIVASPVLDAEGNVYVIANHPFTDHRVSPPVQRLDAVLHKFTAGGGWLRQIDMPSKYGASGTTAAPNLWKSGDAELIIVIISYELPLHGGWEPHLLAFSTDGGLLADTTVSDITGKVTGGSGLPDWAVYSCLLPPFIHCVALVNGGFQSKPGTPNGPVHDPVKQPTPTAAIYPNPGGPPHIVVADGSQNLVDYTFGGKAFNEIFRIHDEDNYIALGTPTITYDGHTIFTSYAGIRFAGPNTSAVPTVKDVYSVTSPTILRNGKIAVMSSGNVAILNGGHLDTRLTFDDFSVAAAAASHNHLFVSTWHHLITYDSETLQVVGRYEWADGGLSQPVIGTQGNVYAIEGNKLYVFPSAAQLATTNAPPAPTAGAPGQPTSQPTPTGTDQPTQTASTGSKAYKPPLTASGNRLLACASPDGEDCGKSDAKAIALAFCQKQGFSTVEKIDTDTRKGGAESLDGQACGKKKCKVFDKIVCGN